MINVGYILKNKKVHRMIKKQSQKPETKTKKKKKQKITRSKTNTKQFWETYILK